MLPSLVSNTALEKPSHIKKAALLTIGYICETADPNNSGVVNQAGDILTAIVQGAQKDEPDTSVRLTAINALVNSLEFIGNNFRLETERNYIMEVVCEATQADDTDLQVAAYGAMARIMSLYYEYMGFYMEQALFSLTVNGMRSSNENVACMAVEFWSTVSEEELEIGIAQNEAQSLGNTSAVKTSFGFATAALPEVLPTLLSLLTKQDEDSDDDDWNVSMAAAACLLLYAQNTGSAVIGPTLEFVERNIGSEDWKNREAAVMAFGSILDGPDITQLTVLIGQALHAIIGLMSDSVLQVRDTAAWCLGRIADLVIDGIDIGNDLPQVIRCVAAGLGDDQKVATNCCWTIMNITEQLNHDGPRSDDSIMSQYYRELVTNLLAFALKSDIEASSRASAYEALSTLVIFSSRDVLQIVQDLAGEITSRLQATISMQQQLVGMEDRANLEELQINLLSLLTNIIRRIGDDNQESVVQLMDLLISLLHHKLPNSLIEEDIFIAIGAVAGTVGPSFEVYMEAFSPYLVNALKDPEYPSISTAIGLIADLSHALGPAIGKYAPNFMALLGNLLQNPQTSRNVKTMILSCFGDIASSLGSGFQTYLEVVMKVVHEASMIQTNVNEPVTAEFIEYISTLREAITDAYVGIVAGLHNDPTILQPYIESIIQFLHQVYLDNTVLKSESTVRSTVGLLGDVASMYPPGSLRNYYSQDWVMDFIKRARTDRSYSSNTRDTARWAREQQKIQVQ